MFIKLKVLFNYYVSVLHYNSDIRIHERTNKFHTLKTSHTNNFSGLGCLCCHYQFSTKKHDKILDETQISET